MIVSSSTIRIFFFLIVNLQYLSVVVESHVEHQRAAYAGFLFYRTITLLGQNDTSYFNIVKSRCLKKATSLIFFRFENNVYLALNVFFDKNTDEKLFFGVNLGSFRHIGMF